MSSLSCTEAVELACSAARATSAQLLDRHLIECPRCRRRVAALDALLAAPFDLDATLDDWLGARLDRMMPGPGAVEPPRAELRARSNVPIVALVAVVFAMILAGIFAASDPWSAPHGSILEEAVGIGQAGPEPSDPRPTDGSTPSVDSTQAEDAIELARSTVEVAFFVSMSVLDDDDEDDEDEDDEDDDDD